MADKKHDKGKGKSPFAALEGMRAQLEKEAKEAEEKKKKPAAAPARPQKPARTQQPRGGVGSDTTSDDLEFHRLMSGVVPLEGGAGRVSRNAAAPSANETGAGRKRREPEPDTTMEHLRVLVAGGATFELTDDGRRVEGHRVDVPPDFMRKLRRGGFPIDGSLDLHGYGAEQARGVLEEFLREKRARGERCLLVVHGKGLHSAGGVGILRGEIAAWLSQGPSSVHVAAFASAHDTDGGEGAVYVLLRR